VFRRDTSTNGTFNLVHTTGINLNTQLGEELVVVDEGWREGMDKEVYVLKPFFSCN